MTRTEFRIIASGIGTRCQDVHPDTPAVTVQNSPRSHCSVCHETFDHPDKFDLHRDPHGNCISPADLGFILRNGFWSTEIGHQKNEDFINRVQSARRNK